VNSKASKEYWEQSYATVKPGIAQKSDTIRLWIEQHFPPVSKNEKKTCIEIGCYPGDYLSVFGELGYELYGIDYCKQLDLMVASLKNKGYSLGRFWKEDFSRFGPQKKFDVVVSFGFIEHFTNFCEVIEKHISLVKTQGYLVVEVPNFIGGFQHWFHVNFDKLNYARHYIPAMDIEKWIDILRKRNFRIIYKGYFGRFHFWTQTEYESMSLLARLSLKVLSKFIRPVLKRALPKDKRMYSPFGGMIAQKK
jgi:2-polyprenyl-3-methyl-5-hydroxy-6-metoxy-1,4-benzoquinol methylase